ncbi:hypothetical protein BGAL_0377g00070 [Botrytis galanthina]|uniref:Uncharacterized protein n=1 Tax=Botrytis galanthina TaxID=278940 RepID=A0A4S8QPD5_9HELO|nr:hypothetical protein BGAL_0377g00070 [Botrytis galanthina]
MSATNWKSAQTPLQEVDVDPDVREEEKKKIRKDVEFMARKGPEQQVGNLLGSITVHMLQQPMMMIVAKRHPKSREYMTPAEITALENQVEKHRRKWLADNPHIPVLYAVTCTLTEMRFWMMKRKRNVETAKMVGLWEPDKRTWNEYRDPGLDCDADIISAAINLIKDHPNGSDYALTTTSDSQSQSDGAPSAVPSRATRGTSRSRRGTPNGDSRGVRNRSRDRRDSISDDQPSSQEETSEQRAERRGRKDRERGEGKESERFGRRDREKDKAKEAERSTRSERRDKKRASG